MLQPPTEEETPSRFAGLAVAAAVAKERRATRPFSQVAPKPDVHLPTAQAGTWSAQRNKEKAGGGAQEEEPAIGTTCAPSGSILTTATILPIRINEGVQSSSSISGATTTITPPLEQLLREMGVVDDDTIEKSLKLQSRLGLYLGGAGGDSKLSGDAARRVVDSHDDNDELDDEERELLTSSLSYQLRNQTEELGAPCEQAVASWTVPVAPVIAASTFLEAFARHAPGGDPSHQSKEHSELFRNFFHKEVVDGWAHGNVAAGTYPPGVGTMSSSAGDITPHQNTHHDCGVIQPIFCRLPPPGAGLPNQGCDLVYPGEMMYIPAPLDKASSSPPRATSSSSSSGGVAPLSSSWLLGGLQLGAASMPATIDSMSSKAFVSPMLSTAAETKLRAKEVAYILQLLTPPPKAIIVSKKVDGGETGGMSALVTDDLQTTLLRRHHWKSVALLSYIDKDLLTPTTTPFSINCRVNLLYLCGFLLSRHAPKSIGRGRESNTTPPEDTLFALSDDSFTGGVPPGVVQAPNEVLSMNHSFFLTIVEKNKELAAGLLQHLFDIKHSFSESADADEVDVETPNHPPTPQTAQPFNDVDRFYGRIALAFRSCLQALVWLPVLVASSESHRLSSSTVDSANLIVSEPLCYVIKVLSERDNESLYGSGGTATTSASILSPAEFAAFVTASTSALMAVAPASAPPTPTASDTRSPVPSSISVPSTTTKRGDAVAEGAGEDTMSELTPRDDSNNAPTLMLGNEFGASATVQLRTPTKVNRSISGLDMSGNSDMDPSRQRRQCQRSAQLLALLLNNIILKRARALHSWDSAQRRNAGSTSSIASSHASPPPPHSGATPDTHPSVLSSLFFDGTVVELTSFALHFRTVKECTELFQTLKRF